MKRGSGTNRFDNDILMSLWDEYENCGYCGMNMADCLDHIEGRGGEYNSSPVNAIPAHNQACNIARHGEIHTHESKVRAFKYVLRRMFLRSYEFTQEDIAFLESHNAAREALFELAKKV